MVLPRADTTHHPRLHRANSLILGIVQRIRRAVEKVVDSMTSIRSHDRTAIRTGDRFATKQRTLVRRKASNEPPNLSYMIFPMSRMRKPGLQRLMDSSRHSLVVRRSFFESSSIWPTGYVALTSPWKPEWRCGLADRSGRTVRA